MLDGMGPKFCFALDGIVPKNIFAPDGIVPKFGQEFCIVGIVPKLEML